MLYQEFGSSGPCQDATVGPCVDEEVQNVSLSLTASYAPAWGLWEGIRETVQNWHDGLLSAELPTRGGSGAGPLAAAPLEFSDVTANGEATRFQAQRHGAEVGWCEFDATARRLVLVNRRVGLGRQVLLMGYSKKAQHHEVIGSFGEGLKVGAVALLRRGLNLAMVTRGELWTFLLAVDPAFGERVLTVRVSRRPSDPDPAQDEAKRRSLPAALGWLPALEPEDTATVLEGLGSDEWTELSQRFLFLRRPRDAVATEVGSLLLEPCYAGRLFVRGVFIGDDPDLASGVDLANIRLDRDRGAVLKKSDLEHQVSSMWVRALHYRPELLARYYELLAADGKCSDTALADLYCDEDTCGILAAHFRQRHGPALPISLKDANTEKAQRVRLALDQSTVVCNQSLLAVLRKGGLARNLDELLREGEARSRRPVPPTSLDGSEVACLAQACALAELADPGSAPLSVRVDIFESQAELSLEGLAATAEAFAEPGGGRVEVDRRALSTAAVHRLVGGGLLASCQEVASDTPSEALPTCCCAQAVLAFALHGARAHGDPAKIPAYGPQRMAALLEAERRAGNASDVPRCPSLGEARETALREQIAALEAVLGRERGEHADALRALQRRVADAEREVAQCEYKFMDAADADRKVREELRPELQELQRLRGVDAELANERAAAAAAAREAADLRLRCEELDKAVGVLEERADRKAAQAEARVRLLRDSLARRWDLMQKVLDLHATRAATPGQLREAAAELSRAMSAGERSQCCVCVDEAVNAVLLPCRHQQLCIACASNLTSCPVCRAPISERLQVYN